MRHLWRIHREQLHQLQNTAVRAACRYREVCRLLARVGKSIRLIPVRNSAKEMGAFETRPRFRQIALRSRNIPSCTVVGSYHSHPLSPSIPGRSDIDGAWEGDVMLIVCAWDRTARLWRIKRGKAIPLPILRR